MGSESNVQVSDVRTALNEIDASKIPDAVIEQKIDDAELDIDDPPSGMTDGTQKRARAIRQQAAYDAFASSPPMVQKSAIDASATWNVSAFMDHLERKATDALEELGQHRGGSSAPIFNSTTGPQEEDTYLGPEHRR